MVDIESDNRPEINKSYSFSEFLEEKARLDAILEQDFTKYITVMFTDMQGSTALAETEGDIAYITLIKRQNDLLVPTLQTHNGHLVKKIGDGTLSYFIDAQDALNAALEIQKKIDLSNRMDSRNIPLKMRVGMHSGKAIFDDNDIFGDVVNVAARFEQIAESGQILFSEETYNNLRAVQTVFIDEIRSAHLKGKSSAVKVYQAFWDKENKDQSENKNKNTYSIKKTSQYPFELKLLVGDSVLSRYRISRFVVENEHFYLYQAVEVSESRQVLINIFKPNDSIKSGVLNIVNYEISLAKKLSHPNIQNIIDCNWDNELNRLCSVTDGSVASELLSEYKKSIPFFNTNKIFDIAICCLKVLTYSHNERIYHCNMTPDNILITNSGEIKIIGFGFSQIQKKLLKGSGSVFISPEIKNADLEIDQRCDIYSLAVSLFSLISNSKEISIKELHESSDTSSSVEIELLNVLKKATQEMPDDRFDSADQMLKALKIAQLDILKKVIGK